MTPIQVFPLILGKEMWDNGGDTHMTATKEVPPLKKPAHRWFSGALGALVAFLLACRVSPTFAGTVLSRFSQHAMLGLHRLTAPMPFPVAEPLALGVAAVPAGALAPAAIRAAVRREAALLICRAKTLGFAALALAGLLTLLWAPAWFLPVADIQGPDDAQLAWLCDSLVNALNASDLVFPAAEESLALAPGVAALPSGAVKAARWPQWMRATHICGLFVPLTGEAIVDAGAAPPLIPFTAVHELMHLLGIADEGAANIAAWRLCLDAGGAFADSARLWALRYALGMLQERDEAAWQRARRNMKDALAHVFAETGAEAVPDAWRGPSPCRGRYTALISRLAEDGE